MKEPVVSNSTCLVCLERIGQLELLPGLFDPFIVPPEVHEEFSTTPSWLQVQATENNALVQALSKEALRLAGEER